jgi:NAD(P)H dehydrogenase (quinone)
MKILIVFYSFYGHIYKMAKAEAEGAAEVEGAEVMIRRVKEILPDEILIQSGAAEVQKEFIDIPICTLDDLDQADAIIFGTPARYGNMISQMRNFLDSTGPLFVKRALVGKIGSVFTCTSTQHGGQEATILSFHITLLHHGMLIAGLPYTFEGQSTQDEITGCSPYGASCVVGSRLGRDPSENELNGARFQGRYVAQLTKKLRG